MSDHVVCLALKQDGFGERPLFSCIVAEGNAIDDLNSDRLSAFKNRSNLFTDESRWYCSYV